MFRQLRREGGQTMIEFGIIASALFILTIGLVDVGRGFYQYSAVSAAARYAARWGSVVGGTCVTPPADSATSDWCNQLGTAGSSSGSDFFTEDGNVPKQPEGTYCPTSYDKTFSYYYTVGSYTGTSSTTIVGAVAHRFDTNSGTSNTIVGGFTPGFDLTKMKVCIDMDYDSGNVWLGTPGERIKVTVYYPFSPAGPLLGGQEMDLVASSQFVIE